MPETTSTPTPTPTPTPEAAPSLVNQQPPAAPAPLTADAITIPEGLTLDNDSMTTFLSVMNNQDLTPAQRAQELVNLQAALTTKSSEAGSQAWNDQQAAWQAEVAADPVLGGANLPTTMAAIGNLMDRFATPEVRAAFDQTGAGNNPHIVRFLTTLHAQLKEPTPIPPGGPGSASQRSAAERIFGNQS